MTTHTAIQLVYLASTVLFILSLKWMSHPSTARRSVITGSLAMLLAVGGTLLYPEIVGYQWVVVGIIVGTVLGVPLSRVPLTAVPQRTALSHAFGGRTAADRPLPRIRRACRRARGNGKVLPLVHGRI